MSWVVTGMMWHALFAIHRSARILQSVHDALDLKTAIEASACQMLLVCIFATSCYVSYAMIDAICLWTFTSSLWACVNIYGTRSDHILIILNGNFPMRLSPHSHRFLWLGLMSRCSRLPNPAFLDISWSSSRMHAVKCRRCQWTCGHRCRRWNPLFTGWIWLDKANIMQIYANMMQSNALDIFHGFCWCWVWLLQSQRGPTGYFWRWWWCQDEVDIRVWHTHREREREREKGGYSIKLCKMRVSPNRGTPYHHPFLDGILPYKPSSYWGYPHLWKAPNVEIWRFWRVQACSTRRLQRTATRGGLDLWEVWTRMPKRRVWPFDGLVNWSGEMT